MQKKSNRVELTSVALLNEIWRGGAEALKITGKNQLIKRKPTNSPKPQ